MIVFHAKRDGTVTTTPQLVPQGSALADLVVVSEFDYAYCTIKLEPASGIYIPDIVCQFVLDSNGTFLWTASLPPEATKTPGNVDYQLVFTASDGTQAATLMGSITIPPGAITNMPGSVGDLETKTIYDLYVLLSSILASSEGSSATIANISTVVSNHSVRIASIEGKIPSLSREVQLSHITIPATEWTDNEAMAYIDAVGINDNEEQTSFTALLIPADAETRRASASAGITVENVTFGTDTSLVHVKLTIDGEAPEQDLRYVVVSFVEPNESEEAFKATVSFVGLGSGGSSSSQIHIGDGDMPEDCTLQIIPDEDDVILDDSTDTPEEPEEPETPEDTETYTLTISGSVYLSGNGLTNGASLVKGTSISTTLYPYASNQIISVTVTMGGVEVPGAFDAETNAFVIENITGDVIITAETEFISSGGGETETEEITITIAKDEHVTVAMNGETVSGNITVNEGSSVYLTLKLDDNYQFATGTPQVTTASGTNITADVYNSTMQEIALLNLTENITIILATEPIPVTAAE